ncbi:MAG: Molybdenum transport ATP-binding protein ModC (TC 3.A.1.8.1) [uncultured Sulfurovum sp.]|uniref:Molybdenum transport ATP-binding protein ModC (TC 3.A.1.8.1) n=1 Tax=uncultured Sulfurovum sp. TaxID=269237 RepID=A0A6S6TVM3_9BACT|nr:MAG: Molybdenum transport ATP-binding protein ModC (TC 3.A.1.8.1) [uncultured Sulfurovum sp.]
MLRIDIKKQLHGSNGVMNLNINCSIKEGEFVAISGKSGSGKTTFLRILAGLEEAEGTMNISEEVWLKGKKALAPQKRNIGFVFQDYALFENMTVEENLLFVKEDKKLANYLLEVTELSKLKTKLPKSLSGGQKQRVALCRAMMNRPQLLLLDEPLSALDSAMRYKLQDEILQLHKEFGTTTIMVSHDASEIYRLASRVLVLENGKIVDDGTAKEVMMGKKNLLEGELLELREDNVATVLVGQQLIEVAFSKEETEKLQIGDFVSLVSHKNL